VRQLKNGYIALTRKKKVSNEKAREKTSLQKLELIIKQRRLRWFGHILRTDETSGDEYRKAKAERPRKNWIDTIRQDLKEIGMSWEEAYLRAVLTEKPECLEWEWVQKIGAKFRTF